MYKEMYKVNITSLHYNNCHHYNLYSCVQNITEICTNSVQYLHAVDWETSSAAISFGCKLADCAYENNDRHADMHQF